MLPNADGNNKNNNDNNNDIVKGSINTAKRSKGSIIDNDYNSNELIMSNYREKNDYDDSIRNQMISNIAEEKSTNQQYIKKVITPFKDKSKTVTKNLIQNHLDNNNENSKEEKYHNALKMIFHTKEKLHLFYVMII